VRKERRKKDRGTWVGRRGKSRGCYDIMPHLSSPFKDLAGEKRTGNTRASSVNAVVVLHM
jgi:hypothetical protein